MAIANSRFAAASAMTKIAERQGDGVAQFFDFQAIPLTFRHLLILWHGDALVGGTPTLQFNHDVAVNYDVQRITGIGAAASAAENLGLGGAFVGDVPGAAPFSGSGAIWIPNYANAAIRKAAFSQSSESTSDVANGHRARAWAVFWRNVAAINRIELGGQTWIVGSVASLYGLS